MIKKKGGKGHLVHPAFPAQGDPQPASAGSQSMSPSMGDNYPPQSGSPIDRMLYGAFN